MLIQGIPYRWLWINSRQAFQYDQPTETFYLLEIVTFDNVEKSLIAVRDIDTQEAPIIGTTDVSRFTKPFQENCSIKTINELLSSCDLSTDFGKFRIGMQKLLQQSLIIYSKKTK